MTLTEILTSRPLLVCAAVLAGMAWLGLVVVRHAWRVHTRDRPHAERGWLWPYGYCPAARGQCVHACGDAICELAYASEETP